MISEEREIELIHFMKKQDIPFNDLKLINQAFVHGSMLNEREDMENNERLEFLGDSVLSICISSYLYINFPDSAEGDLSRMRSYIVSEKMLAKLAKRIGLDRLLLLGWGEENTGGRKRDANLADTFEAFLGAVFLDTGMDEVKVFLYQLVEKDIKKVSKEDFIFDYKTELQYIIQKKYKICPEYRVIKEEGPPHEKVFFTELILNDKIISSGNGTSKKRAEQDAAKCALEKIHKREIEI